MPFGLASIKHRTNSMDSSKYSLSLKYSLCTQILGLIFFVLVSWKLLCESQSHLITVLEFSLFFHVVENHLNWLVDSALGRPIHRKLFHHGTQKSPQRCRISCGNSSHFLNTLGCVRLTGFFVPLRFLLFRKILLNCAHWYSIIFWI